MWYNISLKMGVAASQQIPTDDFIVFIAGETAHTALYKLSTY